MKCAICGAKLPETTLFRFNKPGEMPAIWRCREHMTDKQKADLSDVLEIVDAIENDKADNLN